MSKTKFEFCETQQLSLEKHRPPSLLKVKWSVTKYAIHLMHAKLLLCTSSIYKSYKLILVFSYCQLNREKDEVIYLTVTKPPLT